MLKSDSDWRRVAANLNFVSGRIGLIQQIAFVNKGTETLLDCVHLLRMYMNLKATDFLHFWGLYLPKTDLCVVHF